LQDGVYDDDQCDGLTLDEIYAFYGFDRTDGLENDESPNELDSDSDLEDVNDQMDADDDRLESWDVNDSDMEGPDTDLEVQSLSAVSLRLLIYN
jgi:hypothetical protein